MRLPTPLPSQDATSPATAQLLSSVINACITTGCSDLHIRAGSAAYGRYSGGLARMQTPVFTAADTFKMVQLLARRELPADGRAVEFSMDHGPTHRLRCHAFQESQGWALAIRIVPARVPTFAELRLPPVVKHLAEPRPGLTLITGPMGSGKSTTAAAVLHATASVAPLHIITIEDPIEHVLNDTPSCVTQREVGRDCASAREALRDALREDPDVLFIGELRDAEDLDLALHAAEMGVAVYTTFHAHGSLATLHRLISMFPSDQQAGARDRIVDALRGILSQRLLRRRGGGGRVLATEALINTFQVKEHLRDPVRSKALSAVIERAGDQGMHTFDQCLLQLCVEQLVEPESAAAVASSPGNLRRALNLASMGAA